MTISCSKKVPCDSVLSSLSLQNIAIFPSSYSTSISPLVLKTTDSSAITTTSLSWANVNFQVIGQTGKRVWQFQGSGVSNAQSLLITYTTDTPYNIGFEGVVSGTVTTSNHTFAINAYPFVTMRSTTGSGKTIVTIEMKAPHGEWGTFSYNIFKNDSNISSSCGNAPSTWPANTTWSGGLLPSQGLILYLNPENNGLLNVLTYDCTSNNFYLLDDNNGGTPYWAGPITSCSWNSSSFEIDYSNSNLSSLLDISSSNVSGCYTFNTNRFWSVNTELTLLICSNHLTQYTIYNSTGNINTAYICQIDVNSGTSFQAPGVSNEQQITVDYNTSGTYVTDYYQLLNLDSGLVYMLDGNNGGTPYWVLADGCSYSVCNGIINKPNFNNYFWCLQNVSPNNQSQTYDPSIMNGNRLWQINGSTATSANNATTLSLSEISASVCNVINYLLLSLN